MLARLGAVLYWLGCILAVMAIGIAVFFFLTEGMQSRDLPEFVGLLAIGCLFWLAGSAFRHIVSGK